MAKEIKQRIVLDGEKEYNQAIKEAQRNLRTLKSELKAETAEMGRNATEQQKAEAKAKSLRQQIAEQEKVVKTLKDALAEVKEKYGDNADEVARWEQKLNNARTVLANMQNDLDGVGSAMQRVNTDAAQVATAAKSASDSIGNIGSAADNISGAIEGIFGALVDRVTAAAQTVWGLIAETAAKADDWSDLAELYGTTPEKIQKLQAAIQMANGDFGTFTTIMKTLAYGGKEDKIQQWFKVDRKGKSDMEYALDVMNNMSEAYRIFGQETTWNTAMSDIFGGKKSADVEWFVSNWDRIRSNEYNLQQGGYLLDEDQIGTMSQIYDLMGKIEKKWEKLQERFAAGFGEVTLDIMTNVEGMMDGVADYMNAETPDEQQQALDKIKLNIEEFFTKVGELIRDSIHIISEVGLSLKESDDPLVAAVGEILVQLADKLQWLTEHAEEVKGAFETIFGAWLLLKLAAVAGRLSSILMSIEAVKAFKGISAATGVASGAAQAGAAAGGGWATAFASAAIKAVPWLAGFGILIENAIKPQGNNDLVDENGNLTEQAIEAGITLDENGKPTGKTLNREKEDANHDLAEGLGIVRENHMESTGVQLKSFSMGKTLDEMTPEERAALVEEIAEKGAEAAKLTVEGPVILDELPEGGAEGDIVEDVDLDETGPGLTRDEAVQAWWDAWKEAAESGEAEAWNAEMDAIAAMERLFGDETESVMQQILERMDEGGYETMPADVPQEWWLTNPANWNGGGLSGQDIEGLKGVPGQMAAATRAGIADGIGRVRVQIDKETVGWLVAPTVSEYIAGQIEA